jgi:hypothetical protein
VRVGVLLAGFVGVVRRVQMVAVRQMGVMSRLLVIGGAVMFRGPAMVLGGGFVMLGGLFVVFSQQACVHEILLLCGGRHARAGIGHRGDDTRPIAPVTIA